MTQDLRVRGGLGEKEGRAAAREANVALRSLTADGWTVIDTRHEGADLILTLSNSVIREAEEVSR